METAQMQLQGAQAATEDVMMSSQDVADYMSMSHAFIKRMAQNNKIPMFKCGTRWRIRRSTLLAWIAEEERANTQPRNAAKGAA